jgi:hypothetical protein
VSRRPARALLLAAVLAGCGGDDAATYQPPQPVEGEDGIKQAWCDALVRCGAYADLDSCLSANDVVGPELREAFESGRADYDAGDAADCAAALGDATCEELAGAADLEACAGVWDGTQEDGEECAASAECAGGWCDPGECDPALSCCTGACAADEEEGGVPIAGDCSIDPCEAGAFCDFQATPATCRELVALDGSCHEGECRDGLYCRVSDPDTGTGACSDLPAEGEACDPDYPVCARGDNWCDPGDDTCHKRAAVGDACDEMADNCVPYAWCSPDGECVARPGEGEPCEDWPPCMGDLECLDDTCVMPPLDDDQADCD